MKRVIAAMLFVVVILCSSITCSATVDMQFDVALKDQKPDRLFDVFVTTNSKEQVCGGGFEVCYNDELVEFRSADSDSCDVEYNLKDGCVVVAFAKDDDTANSDTQVDLTFKAVDCGQSEMDISKAYCVCDELNRFDCDSKSVSLNVTQNDVSAKVSTKSSKQKVDGNNDDEQTMYEDDDQSECEDNNGQKSATVNNSFDKSDMMLVVGSTALGVCALVMFGYFFAKFSGEKKGK